MNRRLIHSSRCRATSGRFCSLASRVFFYRCPWRIRNRERLAGAACVPVSAFKASASSGIVMSGLSLTRRSKKSFCAASLPTLPPRRPGAHRTASPPTVHELDRATGAHPKMRRRPTPRAASFNKSDDPLTQIQGKRRAHDPPPTMVKHDLPHKGKPLFDS